MIQEFVDAFIPKQASLFTDKHPDSYQDIVRAVIETINPDGEEYDKPDPKRIHMIDDGDYQGTLLFLIAAVGYQPWDYWYVRVGYGSCSGCDTLEAIRSYDDAPPTEQQTKDYQQLALHIVQGLHAMQGETV